MLLCSIAFVSTNLCLLILSAALNSTFISISYNSCLGTFHYFNCIMLCISTIFLSAFKRNKTFSKNFLQILLEMSIWANPQSTNSLYFMEKGLPNEHWCSEQSAHVTCLYFSTWARTSGETWPSARLGSHL